LIKAAYQGFNFGRSSFGRVERSVERFTVLVSDIKPGMTLGEIGEGKGAGGRGRPPLSDGRHAKGPAGGRLWEELGRRGLRAEELGSRGLLAEELRRSGRGEGRP
jgi:hypothetical protein